MGTRGAMGFYKNGKHKVTYNHFDSYPECLGQEILDYINNCSIDELNMMCDRIELVEKDSIPTSEQIQKCKDMNSVDLTVGDQTEKSWYCLLRNCQGNLESYAEVGFMVNSADFLNDSLWCEYAYIINLDDNTLEVYEGFQESKPKGRYSEVLPNKNGNYAVGLVNVFSLEDCPIYSNALVPEDQEKDQ